MAALLRVLALALLPFTLCEHVPPPVNLTFQAVNTNYILHWKWDGRQSATFPVQYIGKFRLKQNNLKWRTACEETPNMSCDLNPVNLHYLGIYSFRVAAIVNGQHSEWTAPVDFAPAKDAAVGPPTGVKVAPAGSDLEVSIVAPQTNSNTSMKDNISSLHYRFLYWERHANQKVTTVNSPNTIVVLKALKSGMWYCVSVQSRTIEPNRTSAFTDPICSRTEDGFDWMKFFWIFGIFLFLAFMILLGIILGCFHSKERFKTSVTQPVFLDDHWRFPPMLIRSDGLSEQCDHLTIVSSSQEHIHSSARPEWQSCSDSHDSGVYTASQKSTSDQSSQLQNIKPVPVQEPCFTPKTAQLIPDEGFGDMKV